MLKLNNTHDLDDKIDEIDSLNYKLVNTWYVTCSIIKSRTIANVAASLEYVVDTFW